MNHASRSDLFGFFHWAAQNRIHKLVPVLIESLEELKPTEEEDHYLHKRLLYYYLDKEISSLKYETSSIEDFKRVVLNFDELSCRSYKQALSGGIKHGDFVRARLSLLVLVITSMMTKNCVLRDVYEGDMDEWKIPSTFNRNDFDKRELDTLLKDLDHSILVIPDDEKELKSCYDKIMNANAFDIKKMFKLSASDLRREVHSLLNNNKLPQAACPAIDFIRQVEAKGLPVVHVKFTAGLYGNGTIMPEPEWSAEQGRAYVTDVHSPRTERVFSEQHRIKSATRPLTSSSNIVSSKTLGAFTDEIVATSSSSLLHTQLERVVEANNEFRIRSQAHDPLYMLEDDDLLERQPVAKSTRHTRASKRILEGGQYEEHSSASKAQRSTEKLISTSAPKRLDGTRPSATTLSAVDSQLGSHLKAPMTRSSLRASKGVDDIEDFDDDEEERRSPRKESAATKLKKMTKSRIEPHLYLNRPRKSHSPSARGSRRDWSAAEETALLDAIERHGLGKWRQILLDADFKELFAERTNIDLKDKARNLKLKGFI